jgi:hypothetical protein
VPSHSGAPQNLQLPSPSGHGISGSVSSSGLPDVESSSLTTEATNVDTPDIPPGLLRDLELMHYYTAFTCLTISDFSSFNDIWQNVVPKEALSHSFLMYGILALAALHLGYDRPQDKDLYTAAALKHYNFAIASFRSALKDVTADNCTALFAFSAILIVLSLAFAQSHLLAQNQNAVEELIQIFTLLQGVRVVLQSAMPWVEQGPLAPLLRRFPLPHAEASAPWIGILQGLDNALDRLEGYNERTSDAADSHKMYNLAIQALKDCLEKVRANPGDRASALNWLVFLESPYVSSLKSNQPLALVILAHYGVVLHGLRQCWFIQGWGIRVIEVVHLNLSDEWRPLVHWPMKKVGLRGEPREADETIEPG